LAGRGRGGFRGAIVVNADDFGMSRSVNEAVGRCVEAGAVTSVSVLAAGEAFEEAAAMLRAMGPVGAGVHLSLTEGRPVCAGREGASPLGRAGRFPARMGRLLARLAAGRVRAGAVAREWRAQIRRCLDRGIVLDHLDGHCHVHLVPGLSAVAAALAVEFDIPFVRIPARVAGAGLSWDPCGLRMAAAALLGRGARPALRKRGRRWADATMSLTHRSWPGPRDLRRALARLAAEVTEVVCHPGTEGGERDRADVFRRRRPRDTSLLLAADVPGWAEELGLRLTDFRALAAGGGG
jgi:predicted glycoside hydrolase/deacetylase ChbG (UPF0249 family)